MVHYRKIENILNKSVNIKEVNTKEFINPLNVNYGFIFNMNFINVIAHLAELPVLIERLFRNLNVNDFGFYKIRVFFNGAWENIVIDQLIPCFLKSIPIYSYDSNLNSYWVLLIEKV